VFEVYTIGMHGPHYDITPRQWRFVQEYLVDSNGTQSAIRAGYAPGSAHVQASRLLRNDKVAAEIARLQRGASYELGEIRDGLIVSLMGIADDGKDRVALKALDLLAQHLGMYNECFALLSLPSSIRIASTTSVLGTHGIFCPSTD